MIALALAAALMVQQDSNATLSPCVRSMIDRFPPPRPGLPSIAIQFSRDSVWPGEQVELVTATWFPRGLRDQLRRLPVITSPSLTGLWSARNQQLPIQAATRIVGNQMYDLYISWQTIFPLGAGKVEAPPATLTYNLPTSTAYFAPEERKAFRSTTTTLVVRPYPAAMKDMLGTGPAARSMRMSWRGPAGPLRAGSPAIVELALSGEGNLTLWPAPIVNWPAGVHVYPEATLETQAPARCQISGEKHFRFTIVADSAGVLTLPSVHYPYFDPGSVQVQAADAPALSLAILQRLAASDDRRALVVLGTIDTPIATRIVRDWWPLLIVGALLPGFPIAIRSRRKQPAAPPVAPADPEAALRRALGTPVDAGEDHVVAALRRRGVSRDEAEHIRTWLTSLGRRRYGPAPAAPPEPPALIARVIARLSGVTTLVVLLCVAIPLHGQREDGVTRFTGGDYPGAARAFEAAVRDNPMAAGGWRDLGAARWMSRDDVGAAAAWLRALSLAPRDPLLRDDWRNATTIPQDVRSRAPTIPLSRDELLLIALAGWLAAAVTAQLGWRRTSWVVATVGVAAAAASATRWHAERSGLALIDANATLRISPHPATMGVGDLGQWSIVRIERRLNDWVLVSGDVSNAGSVGGLTMQGWVPAAVVAPIGPLD